MHSTLYSSTDLVTSSHALGNFQKSGTSLAEDVVHHVEGIWQRYNIEYANITCDVTDTEATMVKAARIFSQ
jgi:hypothetical protein